MRRMYRRKVYRRRRSLKRAPYTVAGIYRTRRTALRTMVPAQMSSITKKYEIATLTFTYAVTATPTSIAEGKAALSFYANNARIPLWNQRSTTPTLSSVRWGDYQELYNQCIVLQSVVSVTTSLTNVDGGVAPIIMMRLATDPDRDAPSQVEPEDLMKRPGWQVKPCSLTQATTCASPVYNSRQYWGKKPMYNEDQQFLTGGTISTVSQRVACEILWVSPYAVYSTPVPSVAQSPNMFGLCQVTYRCLFFDPKMTDYAQQPAALMAETPATTFLS